MKLYQVDAFTEEKFRGNPAAVCLLTKPMPDRWMLEVASEMNLSETAFLLKQSQGYDLRWFTPIAEVDLCGHATLASAHTLWECGLVARNEMLSFHTRSGELKAKLDQDWIQLDFPKIESSPTPPPREAEDALGIKILEAAATYAPTLIAEVASVEILKSIQPNYEKLKNTRFRSIAVTTQGNGSPYDFVSRYFAPKFGIAEDPVTGSAHCALLPYWSKKNSKKEMTAYQASPRGGILKLILNDDRVLLSGKAVTVLKGELL